jgi:hypothetical protein
LVDDLSVLETLRGLSHIVDDLPNLLTYIDTGSYCADRQTPPQAPLVGQIPASSYETPLISMGLAKVKSLEPHWRGW